MILSSVQGKFMPKIELIYATPQQQKLLTLVVKEGATIADCIQQSGVLLQHKELDINTMKVGIFSQIKPLSQTVVEGDRIEIYRPLIADPKAVRRKKAELAAQQKN